MKICEQPAFEKLKHWSFVLAAQSVILCYPYSDVIWESRHLKSLATWLLVEQFVQADNKENIKGLHYHDYWPFVRGINVSVTNGDPTQKPT